VKPTFYLKGFFSAMSNRGARRLNHVRCRPSSPSPTCKPVSAPYTGDSRRSGKLLKVHRNGATSQDGAPACQPWEVRVEAVSVMNEQTSGAFVFTCEHASCDVPVEYDGLGLDTDQLHDHIGWDIGARSLTTHLARTSTRPLSWRRVPIGHRLQPRSRRSRPHPMQSHGVRCRNRMSTQTNGTAGSCSSTNRTTPRSMRCCGASAIASWSVSTRSRAVLNGRERRFDVGVAVRCVCRGGAAPRESSAGEGRARAVQRAVLGPGRVDLQRRPTRGLSWRTVSGTRGQ